MDDTIKYGEDNSLDFYVRKPLAIKKVPHYLSTSSSSCHDACKYEHTQIFKDKPIHTSRRRLSASISSGEKEAEFQIIVDKKARKILQSTKTSLAFTSSRLSPVLNSSKAKSLTSSSLTYAPKAKEVVQPVGRSSLSVSSKYTKQQIASAAKANVFSKGSPSNPNVTSSSLKVKACSKKPKSLLESSIRSITSETTENDNVRNAKKAISKSVGPIVTKISSRTSRSMPKNLSTQTTTRKSLEEQNQVSKVFVNKVEKVNIVKQKECANEVQEKPSRIETKEDYISSALDKKLLDHSLTSWSSKSLNSTYHTMSLSPTSYDVDELYYLDMKYTYNGLISNNNSSCDSKASKILKHGNKLMHNPEHQDLESLMLKFKKGKEINHQFETNGLRSLVFSQGLTLGHNQVEWKNLRKSHVECRKDEEETKLVKVVLKHQDIEEKKDEHVPSNNMIEETASKLAEKKNSKVKALVGAFETIDFVFDRWNF